MFVGWITRLPSIIGKQVPLPLDQLIIRLLCLSVLPSKISLTIIETAIKPVQLTGIAHKGGNSLIFLGQNFEQLSPFELRGKLLIM